MSEKTYLPNTDSVDAMQLAIAFEIARISMGAQDRILDRDQYSAKFIQLFMKAKAEITGIQEENKRQKESKIY